VHAKLASNGQFATLFARLCALLGDEKALKEIVRFKGAAGRLPCGICKNICSAAWADREGLVGDWMPLFSLNVVAMRFHTDGSIKRIFERLQWAHDTNMPITHFTELERRLGYAYSPHALVMAAFLNFGAVTCLMFDWMHVYLVKGIFTWEAGKIMYWLFKEGNRLKLPHVTYADLHEYLQRWQWPKALASPHDLCNERHAHSHLENQALGGTASELLSVAPVLARYLDKVVAKTPLGEACKAMIKSCLACVDVVELLQCVARTHVDPKVLHDAILAHLGAHQEAYGTDDWKPKHHMAIHLPIMLERFGTLISCFVMERRHQSVRMRQLARKTLDRYEGGLICEITNDSLAAWAADGLTEGLVNAHPAGRRLRRAVFAAVGIHPGFEMPLLTATKAYVNGCRITHGDVVLVCKPELFVQWRARTSPVRRWGCAEVWCHIEFEGDAYTFVSPWPVTSEGDRHAKLDMIDNPILVKTSALLAPLIHMRGEGTCLALIPLQYR